MTRLLSIYVSISLFYFFNYAHGQFTPSTAPLTWREGQTGVNQCGTANTPTSKCQNAYLNSGDDFCLWGPPQQGAYSTIGNMERVLVSWCTKNGTGTRTIPDGAIRGAHFVQTPDFVQVTGIGNLTLINIPVNDAGGELDPHGADGLGNDSPSAPSADLASKRHHADVFLIALGATFQKSGNPLGGLVFSSAFGRLEQVMEWTLFISFDQFCFRACKPGPNAAKWCQHIYDQMGCAWNMPGDYGTGFDSCKGDSGEPMGIYGTSTFYQGSPQTPLAHLRPSISSCSTSGATSAVVAAVPTQMSNLNPPNTTGTDPSLSIHGSTLKGPASSTSGASASSGVRPLTTGASFPPGGHPGPNTNANTSVSSASQLRRQAGVVILLTVVGIIIGGLEV